MMKDPHTNKQLDTCHQCLGGQRFQPAGLKTVHCESIIIIIITLQACLQADSHILVHYHTFGMYAQHYH